MANQSTGRKILGENRKARFNYTVTESYECGIALVGTEVKSMKSGRFSFVDSYARIKKGEVFLESFNITPYEFGTHGNHEPTRPRRLLLRRHEINKLTRKVDRKGCTLVPMRFYLKKGLVKLDLGVCVGKKQSDKRAVIRDRDEKIAAERELRNKY